MRCRSGPPKRCLAGSWEGGLVGARSQYRSVMDETPHRSLTAEEVRVLGCLIEKSLTTPDDYPLTANALMRAANQSTSREPVVSYDPATVDRAATSLKSAGLVRFVHMASGRATTRYRHSVSEALGLDAAEVALLGLLLIRGAQTPGELKTRSERWHAFADTAAILDALEALAARHDGLVMRLERQAGHKEARWTHLMVGHPVLPAAGSQVASAVGGPDEFRGAGQESAGERIAALERRVDGLEAQMAELRTALGLGEST